MGVGLFEKNFEIDSGNIDTILTNGLFHNTPQWNTLFIICLTIFIIIPLFSFLFTDIIKKQKKKAVLYSIVIATSLTSLFLYLNPRSEYQNSLSINNEQVIINFADGSQQNIAKNDIKSVSLHGSDFSCQDLLIFYTLKDNSQINIQTKLPSYPELFCDVDPLKNTLQPRRYLHDEYVINLDKEDDFNFVSTVINQTPIYFTNILLEIFCIFFIIFFFFMKVEKNSFNTKSIISSIFIAPLVCILFFSALKNESHYAHIDNQKLSVYFFNKTPVILEKKDIKNIKMYKKYASKDVKFIVTDTHDKKYNFIIKADYKAWKEITKDK